MKTARKKKILIVAASVVLFLVLINYAAVLLVRQQIPKILTKNPDIPYNITYKTLDFSVWTGFLSIDSLVVSEKNAKKIDSVSLGLFTKIKKIEILEFSVWNTLFTNKISAGEINIIAPKIILYKNNSQVVQDYKKTNSAIFDPLERILKVKKIQVANADITVLNALNNKILLNVANLNVQIGGIKLSKKTLKNNIPIDFDSYSIRLDSMLFVSDAFYLLKTKEFKIENKQCHITSFELLPLLSKKEFTATVPKEVDRFDVKVSSLSFDDISWGFTDNRFYANTKNIILDGIDAEIYRNKLPQDDLSKKKLYSELLRNLSFDLSVNQLQIKNSTLVYQEEINFEKGAAELVFEDFNLTANNLESGYGKDKIEDTKIAINCKFMKSSPLKIDWSWNTLNKSDSFRIKGSILNFENSQITPFTKPYLNAKVSGKINALYFNFNGNDFTNTGNFRMEYNDLKVEIYQKKDRSKVNKLLTAVGNLFVKKDSKEKPKLVKIETKRDQTKSFYNFLWISIADGLKQVLI